VEEVDRRLSSWCSPTGTCSGTTADAVSLAELAEHAVEVRVLAIQAPDDDDARVSASSSWDQAVCVPTCTPAEASTTRSRRRRP